MITGLKLRNFCYSLASALLLTVIGIQPAAIASESTDLNREKLAAIKELMEITGAAANAAQFSQAFTQQMIAVLKVSNPDISERALQIVREEVANIVSEQLAQEALQAEIYPLYARHFTLEELQGLIAFNKSPVGRKANAVMPQLIQESLVAGQEWSKQVQPIMSERILKRFQQEGISIRSKAPKR